MSTPDPDLDRQLAALARALDADTPLIDGAAVRQQVRPSSRGSLGVRGRFLVAMAAVVFAVAAAGAVLQVQTSEITMSQPSASGGDPPPQRADLQTPKELGPRDTYETVEVLEQSVWTRVEAQEPEPDAVPAVNEADGLDSGEAAEIAEAAGTAEAAPDDTGVSSSTTTAPAVLLPPAEDQATVYEPFTFDPGLGFAEENWYVWGETNASDANPLTYQDASGAELVTDGGAIRMRTLDDWGLLTRPLVEPLVAADGYYVSFLLRIVTETEAGDAFWTPDGLFDRNGVGFQSNGVVQFVNGPRTAVPIEPKRTYLIVVKIHADGAALWVDPLLGEESPPLVTDSIPTETATEMVFSMNGAHRTAYVFDEIRVGPTFASVTPRKG